MVEDFLSDSSYCLLCDCGNIAVYCDKGAVMDFEREIEKIKKNIHISRAVSKLPFKTQSLRDILRMLSSKYSEHDVKEACKNICSYNRDIPDIKNLIAAYTVKSFKARK